MIAKPDQFMSSLTIVIVIGDPKPQLEYYYHRNITRENREFVPIDPTVLTGDGRIDTLVMGYIERDGVFGYWKNKHASILSYVIGPDYLIYKDGSKRAVAFKKNLDVKRTAEKLNKFKFRVLIDKKWNTKFDTFEEVLSLVTGWERVITIASVEFL